MDLPAEARRRIESDAVAWLTTITDSGAPAPNPVWFVPDGDDLIVFSAPSSRKVHNIKQRPQVCLHFNSDATGGDIVIINGLAELALGQKPSAQPGFLAKYEAAITGELGTTVEAIDAEFDTRIRITPARVRLTPTA
jgi:PPOX class probable F420-dependent enzyme